VTEQVRTIWKDFNLNYLLVIALYGTPHRGKPIRPRLGCVLGVVQILDVF